MMDRWRSGSCLWASTLLFAVVAIAKPLPLTAVPTVNIERYAGTWYEIARYPNRFQQQCVGDVVARYRRFPTGMIEVINRCRTAPGSDEAHGVARPIDAGDFTRLEVRFAPAFLSFLPFVWGQYWVIELAADYSYALIGEPSREYLWVLARAPKMDEQILQKILERAAAQGYDPTHVVRTPSGTD